MRGTYRALAIVAVVATLVSIGSIVWSSYTFYADQGYSFSALGLPILGHGLSTVIMVVDIPNTWHPVTNMLAAPIVATFAIIVAAQARRWGWLVAFIALSLFCVFGPGSFYAFWNGFVIPAGNGANVMISNSVAAVIPMILLAIVALIFALRQSGGAPADASTGSATGAI